LGDGAILPDNGMRIQQQALTKKGAEAPFDA